MFIEAMPCFEGTCGFRRPGTRGRSHLGRGSEEEHMCVGLLRASGSFGTGRRVHRGGGPSRAAARSRRNNRGIGHHWRAGVTPSVGPSLVREGGALRPSRSSRPPCWLLSSSGPARLSPSRRSWGLFETSWPSRAFRFGAGSFDGPSNTRCSRRAAQWHRGRSQGCSSAARG